jgi:hypothetical protein
MNSCDQHAPDRAVTTLIALARQPAVDNVCPRPFIRRYMSRSRPHIRNPEATEKHRMGAGSVDAIVLRVSVLFPRWPFVASTARRP